MTGFAPGSTTTITNGHDNGSLPSHGQARPLAHYKDIVYDAEQAIKPNASIARLVNDAKAAITAAETGLSFKRPDHALKEYIIANILVTITIPKHKDYSQLRNQPRVKAVWDDCVKALHKDVLRFERLIQQVQEDNHSSGARQRHGLADHAKPPVHAKPQNLHGRALLQNDSDPLISRFSAFRISETPRPVIRPDLAKDLPKPPDPTYSPVADNGTTYHEVLHNGLEAHSYSYSPMLTGFEHEPPKHERQRRHSMPQEIEISAERLHDYMRTYSLLLIDVRSRENFDIGHIFSNFIVCIEPTVLRPNRSAEQLQDSLVLDTDHEYELFSRRQEFDLIVYFDQSTKSTDFLEIVSDSPLRYLHDSLTLYNTSKPLKWQPVLLVGGMDAWIDLVGLNSLVTSNTAVREKAVRPLSKRPANRIHVQKRRRDYNPLAPEEEEKWRRRAQSESVAVQDPEEGAEILDKYPDLATVEYHFLASHPPSRAPPDAPRPFSYPQPPVSVVPLRPPPAVPRPSYSGVSERALATKPPVTKVPHLPAFIPDNYRRLPKIGLYNFGVTCFMNSTIQCLSATLPLTVWFMQGHYKRDIQRDNWKGSKGLMPELYHTLLSNLWQTRDHDTIRPTNFRKFCTRLNSEWGQDRQQDAKEFLDFLLDTLHEDFNLNWARNPLRVLTADEEALRERTPFFLASKNEFARYLHRDMSKIVDLFSGQHISRLECTTCGRTSTTYETFSSLSIEIPQQRGPVSLDDCMRSYCSSETLSGDELWKCPHCKREREATKRITISRAPQFLIIHFKRFSASRAGSRKVHTPVDFPLHDFDLGPYMLPLLDTATSEFLETNYGSKALETPEGMQPPYKYEAYAVMRHLGGTMTSGHYISLCQDRARGCWREFNDDRVTDFKPESLSPSRSIQNGEAYIVFYQRI